MTSFEQSKKSIMEGILYILDEVRKDRSFLNKHFQNSINNYFLEDYAGSYLKDHLQVQKAKQITQYILNKTKGQIGTKYMKLIYGYIDELKQLGRLSQFQSLLIKNIINEDFDFQFGSKEWQSFMWKRAFSLFVYHASIQNDTVLKGVFEIWNSLYPNDSINRKRQENVSHRQNKNSQMKVKEINPSETHFFINDTQYETIQSTNFTSNLTNCSDISENTQEHNLGDQQSQAIVFESLMNEDNDCCLFEEDDVNYNQSNDQIDLIGLIREANQGYLSSEIDQFSQPLNFFALEQMTSYQEYSCQDYFGAQWPRFDLSID